MAGCSLDNARASQRGAYAKLHTQHDLPSRLPYQTQNIHVSTTPSTTTSPETIFRPGSESAGRVDSICQHSFSAESAGI